MKMKFNCWRGFNCALSIDEILNILSKDFTPDEGTTLEVFQNNNLFGYSLLIQTWVAMIDDEPGVVSSLVSNMLSNGLRATVNDALKANDCLVHGCLPENSLWRGYFVRTILKSGSTFNNYRRLTTVQDSDLLGLPSHIFTHLNTVTKYPKRFSPCQAYSFDKSCEEKFIQQQKALRILNNNLSSSYAYEYWAPRVAAIIREALPWSKICRRIRNIIDNNVYHVFTPGATATTSSSLGEKILEISKSRPSSVDGIFNTNVISLVEEKSEMVPTCKIILVNKNLNSKRVIAAEHVARQSIAYQIFKMMAPHLHLIGIHLEDQSLSRSVCAYASLTGDVATTDLSSASDSITPKLFADVFPTEFTALIEPLLPAKGKLGNRVITLGSRCTMGNALTFILLSILSWAMDKCAMETYTLFTGEEFKSIKVNMIDTADYRHVDLPIIYGDDQEHPSLVMDLVIKIHSALGFTINESKTYYGKMPYREACGVEYFNGEECTALYFPRKTVFGFVNRENGVMSLKDTTVRDSFTEEFVDSTSTIVQLQRRLMLAGYTKAADIVNALVREIRPEMTSSTLDSYQTSDLLDFAPITKGYYRSPHGEILSKVYTLEGKNKNYLSEKELTEMQCAGLRIGHTTVDYVPCIDYSETDPIFGVWANKQLLPPVRSYRYNCYNTLQRSTYIAEALFEGKKYYYDNSGTRKCVSAQNDQCTGEGKHLSPSVQYEGGTPIDNIQEALINQWLYNKFLASGPEYEHSIDTFEGQIERICGITYNPYYHKTLHIPGDVLNKLFGKPVIKWSLKPEF